MHRCSILAATGIVVTLLGTLTAAEPELPQVVHEDFEQGAERWQPFDAEVWRLESMDGSQVYSQFKKQTNYRPPHRSPLLIALLKDVYVSDFDLRLRVKSTHPDYGHRDACIVFGYQDPAHFYYVHLGKQMDDHANQIFIVNDAPRVKISTKTTAGTPWDDQWHDVRIVRRTEDGTIAVYFDDMENPVMTAEDKHFLWGQIGLGSFDDTTAWDNVTLHGRRVDPATLRTERGD